MITYHWAKGAGTIGNKICLVNAIDENQETTDEFSACLDHVRATIKQLFPSRTPNSDQVSIFNDHPETTLEDINKVCEAAKLPFRFVE